MSFFEMINPHAQAHRGEHAGWLGAAMLGANDGLVSTASPMVGVAASRAAAALAFFTEDPMTRLAAQQLSASLKALQRKQVRVLFLNSAPDSSSQADLWSPKLKSNRRAQHRPRFAA